MQQSQFPVLAGGHEEHFSFLPGGELVSKKSGLREVYFYVWLYRLVGKRLIHATSIDTFLEELQCRNNSAAPAIAGPAESSPRVASEVQAKTAVGAQIWTEQLPSVLQSDEALWRTLIIPGSSGSRDEFAKSSLEYRRQALAIIPWLPRCLGTVEHIHASTSSTSIHQNAANEAGCQGSTTAAQCATNSANPARPTGEVVMENLLHGMKKPAVFDTKLGTKYYGEEVSAIKREKEARYARERGTHEVGMAFSGYCCGSPFEEKKVSVSGGSRAPSNFKHPKTVEAFSDLIQRFLMLQGDTDIAISLGRTFARMVSELILLWRSVQEKPLVNFFGSSVLLIYDAGGQGAVNVAGGEKTHGAGNVTFDAEHLTRRTEAEDVKFGCNVEDVAYYTAVTLAKGRERKAVKEAQDTAGRVSSGEVEIHKRDGKVSLFVENGCEGRVDSKCRPTVKDATATTCVETEEGGVPCINSDITVRDSEKNSGEVLDRESTCTEAHVTDLCSVGPTLLNAKVRIVDFAHVIILPQQVEEGFIFGLQNFRAALDLATQSLENSKRCQVYAAQ